VAPKKGKGMCVFCVFICDGGGCAVVLLCAVCACVVCVRIYWCGGACVLCMCRSFPPRVPAVPGY